MRDGDLMSIRYKPKVHTNAIKDYLVGPFMGYLNEWEQVIVLEADSTYWSAGYYVKCLSRFGPVFIQTDYLQSDDPKKYRG